MRTYTLEEQIAAYDQATLMDDAFMSMFFKDNIPCTQLMLRVILEKPDLIVESVKVQYILTAGEDSHYVRLDVWALEKNGTQIDAEVQNESSGASPQRARYNSAMLDVNILKPKEDYSVLKKRESFVIFITEKDVLGEGEPIYIIDRTVKKSGKAFNDGSHIVYVNASYQDLTTELGKLMHDFHCVRPDDMLNPEFSEKAEKVKGVKKVGVFQDMVQDMEANAIEKGMAEGRAKGMAEGRAEGLAEGKAEACESIAQKLIAAGKLALEEIASVCGLTLQHVQELAQART
ncbi:MAG: Rpn family recombination-promoting nuclease/putative transposase [Synergistaceae bacterium]|nr:Rpn family recombination-promoting nuclease/putative transposase [Synergistaceae bacterium]